MPPIERFFGRNRNRWQTESSECNAPHPLRITMFEIVLAALICFWLLTLIHWTIASTIYVFVFAALIFIWNSLDHHKAIIP